MGRLKFQTRGTGERALICLHGFLGEGSDWEKFAEAFIMHSPDWQVVMIDLPGHSEEDVDWICLVADEFAQDLRDLVAAEGWGTAGIAGYSLGGRLGLHAALSFPEVFPVFIGISTTAGIDDEAERARRIEFDSAIASRLRSGTDFAGFLREWWHQPVFASPARDSGDVENFVTSRQLRNPLRMAACLETWSSGRMLSQWSGLTDYSGRALLLSGDADGKYTTIAARMQSVFQNAEQICIAGAGHQLLAEKPQEVADIVSAFLNQLE
jgi:2-succinyl-6-hydroxy-2,4-cyclohexadiene-1-carboxylate synthase